MATSVVLDAAQHKRRLLSESAQYETVTELIYTARDRKALTQEQAEEMSCACKLQEGEGPICCSEQCVNFSSRTECPLGTCSKKRCCNKRFQRQAWANVEKFAVRCMRVVQLKNRTSAQAPSFALADG